jgi:hypothetical protein
MSISDVYRNKIHGHVHDIMDAAANMPFPEHGADAIEHAIRTLKLYAAGLRYKAEESKQK